MERTRFLAAIAVAGIVCAPSGLVSAQDNKVLGETLSASERAEAVNEIAQGCLEHQRAAPENKGVSESAMQAYCRCTAERMVAGFTAAEIEKVVDGITPELQARIDRIEQLCLPKAK